VRTGGWVKGGLGGKDHGGKPIDFGCDELKGSACFQCESNGGTKKRRWEIRVKKKFML